MPHTRLKSIESIVFHDDNDDIGVHGNEEFIKGNVECRQQVAGLWLRVSHNSQCVDTL
jgi:hypothetical protein